MKIWKRQTYRVGRAPEPSVAQAGRLSFEFDRHEKNRGARAKIAVSLAARDEIAVRDRIHVAPLGGTGHRGRRLRGGRGGSGTRALEGREGWSGCRRRWWKGESNDATTGEPA